MQEAENDSQVFETCFQLFHLVTYLNIMEYKSRQATAENEVFENADFQSEMQRKPDLVINIQYFTIVL